MSGKFKVWYKRLGIIKGSSITEGAVSCNRNGRLSYTGMAKEREGASDKRLLASLAVVLSLLVGLSLFVGWQRHGLDTG